MKMIVAVALAFVAVAAALPVQEETIPIVRSEYSQSPDGSFQYAYETGNGIVSNTQGEVKQVVDEENNPQQVVVFRGEYSYPDENGNPIRVTYVADENGFKAEGDSIPKVPAARR